MSSKNAQMKSGASETFQYYIPNRSRQTYEYYYHEINIKLPANLIIHSIQTTNHGLPWTSLRVAETTDYKLKIPHTHSNDTLSSFSFSISSFEHPDHGYKKE